MKAFEQMTQEEMELEDLKHEGRMDKKCADKEAEVVLKADKEFSEMIIE